MHVAIYGAGALGAVYGVRLATRTHVDVSFVVRKNRVSSTDPIVVEGTIAARTKRSLRESIEAPVRVERVPEDADVVLLAVATNDLEAVLPTLEDVRAPVVVLTPMMPRDYAKMRTALGARVLAAMPALVSERRDDGVFHYWQPPSPTRIDEPRAGAEQVTVRALAQALEEAGMGVRFELGVHETNPATTVCAIPLAMAVCIAGNLHALNDDPALLDLATQGCDEGVLLGRRLGTPLFGATFAPMMARPASFRALVAVLDRWFPDVVHYVDAHFGQKLVQQHREMIHAMLDLARERGTPHEAFEEIASRLDTLTAATEVRSPTS